MTRQLAGAGLLLVLSGFLLGCGGGGSSDPGVPIVLASVEVTTQTAGPLSPFGTTRGGDEVTIRGEGFATGLKVRFGLASATVVQVTSEFVRVTSPSAASEGPVAIAITNPGSRSYVFPAAFQYVAPPSVTSIEIKTGPTTGETRVPLVGGETCVVSGSNLKPGLTFYFDRRALVPVVIADDRIEFVVPSSSTERSVDISVENPEGLSSTLSRVLSFTQEFSLEPESGLLTQVRARHLFRRAAFGATPARIEQAATDGLRATVDALLTYTTDAAAESEALALWGAGGIPTRAINRRVPRQWWTQLMLKNPNPFQERFAWFLHDNFAVSNDGFPGDAQWYFYHHVNTLRRCSMATSDTTDSGAPGLGYDWRKMLIEMSKDRAMLHWLDGRLSRRGNPNENFARELWELFSLGEGNGYTEADIQAAANAFTGFEWWRERGNTADTRLRIRYRDSRHDERDKTIFGVTGKFGYDDIGPFYWSGDTTTGDYDTGVMTDVRDTDGGVVALTLRMRDVQASQFICRKLAAFFLYQDPHDIVVDELATQLRAPGSDQWNLKPIIQKILLSKAMYSARAIKGQVRSPVEFALEFMRTTGVDLHATSNSTNTFLVNQQMAEMGQLVLDPPDVAGWPVGNAWLSSQGMLARTNFVNATIEGLDDFDTQIAPLVPPNGQRSPTQLVDHIARILDVQLAGNARTQLIQYVTTQEQGGSTVPFPYSQSNKEHVKMKTRGLLYLIAHYHDAHQN